MPKTNLLATPVKKLIVAAKQDGEKVRSIAQRFNISPGAVSKIYKRHRETGDVSRLSKSGRPRKTTEDQNRMIARYIKIRPTRSATDAVSYAMDTFGTQITTRTGRRILNRLQLFARRAARTPLLKKCHRQARLLFLHNHRNWTCQDWSRVLWSDETKINLYNPDGGHLIRRPPNSRFKDRYTHSTVKFNGGSIMVWGKLSMKPNWYIY